MLKTEPTLVRVHQIRPMHIWLHILEGEDKGIRVSVPRLSDDHSRQIGQQLNAVSEGEVYEVVLWSEEWQSPKWRVDWMEQVNVKLQ